MLIFFLISRMKTLLPPSISELTPIIFIKKLTHLGSEVSIYSSSYCQHYLERRLAIKFFIPTIMVILHQNLSVLVLNFLISVFVCVYMYIYN